MTALERVVAAPSRRRPRLSRLAGRIWDLILVLELALDVRRERRMLLRLDDRALKDIGCNRGEAYGEAHRPFWDIPRARLHAGALKSPAAAPQNPGKREGR